ncbi:hypothetical protein ACWCPT_14810 [Streptomyces sp. NPDC002308]
MSLSGRQTAQPRAGTTATAADRSRPADTVKTHLGNVQGRLAARNRVEIAAWAWRNGLGGAAG